MTGIQIGDRGEACRALLVDLDGTLAESLEVMWTAYVLFLASLGCEESATDREFQSLVGPPLSSVTAAICSARRLPASPELVKTYRAIIESVYSDVRPRSGAEHLLRRARSCGWSTCVVTSAETEFAAAWLGRVGLADLVDHVIGSDLVRHGKPDPEPYLLGLALCAARASDAIAVEDSISGVSSAVAAGIPSFLLVPDDQAGDRDPVPPGVVRWISSLNDLLSEIC